jgi:hypothetical protein
MIVLSRLLARQLRAVLRRCVPAGAGRAPKPLLLLQADEYGLRIQAQQPEVALEFHRTGNYNPENMFLPGEALEDFEGARDVPVLLEKTAADAVVARWDDAGVPQVRQYASPNADNLTSWPELPMTFGPAGPDLLSALEHALHCTARETASRREQQAVIPPPRPRRLDDQSQWGVLHFFQSGSSGS